LMHVEKDNGDRCDSAQCLERLDSGLLIEFRFI